jgi:N-sulfoglucosamine sulfohydrolase
MQRPLSFNLPATCFTLLILSVTLRSTAAADAPPNVMLVIADDMTWRDCGPYGNSEVRTPNLSKLASEGMCFDACFTSTAMCAPTRSQLYTGMWPVRNGAYPNHSAVRPGTKSIAHHLQTLGYRVGLIGKTHIKPKNSFPFEYFGGKDGASDTAAIAEFVNRDKLQPYCLIVASNEPHTPWNKGDASRYPPAKLTLPPYLEDTPATRQALSQYYAEIEFLDSQVGGCLQVVEESGRADKTIFLFTSEQGSALPFAKWTCYDLGLRTGLIVRWPGYIKPGSRTDAMVQYVDVVPTLLEAAGADPTKIDAGRPGSPSGSNGFDGRSFLNVLLGKASTHRDLVFGAHTTRGTINASESYPIRSARNRSIKYIRNLSHESVFDNANTKPGGGGGVWESWIAGKRSTKARGQFYQRRPAEELYDLGKDPFEMHNLINDPQYAAVKVELSSELDTWMKQQGDKGVATEMRATDRQKVPGKRKR